MESLKKVCYMVAKEDNVATAMDDIECGAVPITGAVSKEGEIVKGIQKIPFGHKMALRDIRKEERIMKYGMAIGIALANIKAGSHVHLHNMKSSFDVRSAELDPETAHARDIEYRAY